MDYCAFAHKIKLEDVLQTFSWPALCNQQQLFEKEQWDGRTGSTKTIVEIAGFGHLTNLVDGCRGTYNLFSTFVKLRFKGSTGYYGCWGLCGTFKMVWGLSETWGGVFVFGGVGLNSKTLNNCTWESSAFVLFCVHVDRILVLWLFVKDLTSACIALTYFKKSQSFQYSSSVFVSSLSN